MEVKALHSFNDYGINERFLTEAAKYPEYQLARVVAQYRGKYKVATAHGEALAQISGKMRFDTEELSAYPAVGDFVMISSQDGYPEAIIHHILTRKSLFVRKAVGVSGQAQPVAANIDTVFLCMSLNQNYNLNRMERYLSIAWDSGAVPVIVLTKSDLCRDLPDAVREVEQISSFSDVVTPVLLLVPLGLGNPPLSTVCLERKRLQREKLEKRIEGGTPPLGANCFPAHWAVL